MTDTALSPTARTRVIRGERARSDRGALAEVLGDGLVAHLAVTLDGAPLVIPTAYAFDLSGPDRDGTLYLHGSVAARTLVQAPEQDVCATVTLVDGLVLARAAFHHSMNYRSAVIIGNPRVVGDPTERDRALDLIVDQAAPGRSVTLRAHTRKELAATRVLALSLREASVKTRAGDPADDDVDMAAGGTWAGVVPLVTTYGEPVRSADCPARIATPDHVAALAAGGA